MVGHLALDQSIGVRIPVSQPIFPTQNGCRRASVFSILMMYGGHRVTGAPNAGLPVLERPSYSGKMQCSLFPSIACPPVI